ncbi:MAG: hypothetical protein GEU90_03640 [Gemmatimonas sp.]|nr:hypothetical protein [Gemmatimonas sp.]
MKRFLVLVAIFAPLAMTGCGQPEVIAEAAIADEGTGERLALGDLPIRILPYDRDAIFDSLEAAYPDPEPPVPQVILDQQQQVQEAQTAWRVAEERWAAVRDSLRTLSDQLAQMQNQGLRGTPQYSQAFEQFGTIESREQQVNQQMEQAFAQFDQLQQATLAAADSVRIQRDIWAEEAFVDFETVIAERLRETGREEYGDTTNAQGMAEFQVPEGQWWIYGRYTLPYEELYWNIPVDVAGDSSHVVLDRNNAESRPVL